MSFGSSVVSPAIRIWRLPSAGIWIRKLQARFFAGDYASAIEAASRAQSSAVDLGFTFRNGGISLLRCTIPSRRLRFRASRRAAAAPGGSCGASQTTPGLGGELPGQFREPRRAGRRRDRPDRRPRARCRCASTNRPSARPAPTALFTMRRSPTNSPPASTRRVASRRSPASICRNARSRLSALGSRRQGAATRTASSASPRRTSPCISHHHHWRARRAAGCRDGAQGRAGGVRRDRPR